jgi:group I intron endonuclease
MEQIGCIYLITCLENNKKYVGQHNHPEPKIRWGAHLYESKKNKRTTKFYNALKKYGQHAFRWEIIYTGPVDSLDNMEAYYAEVYESYIWDNPGGYNMIYCGGGCRGRITSQETREKIGKANTGKKQSLDAREKNRQSQIIRLQSPEEREKIRQSSIGRKQSPEAREKIRQARLDYWAKKKASKIESQSNV